MNTAVIWLESVLDLASNREESLTHDNSCEQEKFSIVAFENGEEGVGDNCSNSGSQG